MLFEIPCENDESAAGLFLTEYHSKVSHRGMITKSFWLHGDQQQLEIPAELISFRCQVILLHR